MSAETVELIQGLIIYVLGLQLVFALLVVFTGSIVLDIFETGNYPNPQNAFEKIVKVVVNSLFGLGPYLYKKFSNFSWITRRLFMLIVIAILSFVWVILYYVIQNILELIFI
jgi:hypothetical protein